MSAAQEAAQITLKLAAGFVFLCGACAVLGMRRKAWRRLNVAAAKTAYALRRGELAPSRLHATPRVRRKGWTAATAAAEGEEGEEEPLGAAAGSAVSAASGPAEGAEELAGHRAQPQGFVQASGRLPLRDHEGDEEGDEGEEEEGGPVRDSWRMRQMKASAARRSGTRYDDDDDDDNDSDDDAVLHVPPVKATRPPVASRHIGLLRSAIRMDDDDDDDKRCGRAGSSQQGRAVDGSRPGRPGAASAGSMEMD